MTSRALTSATAFAVATLGIGLFSVMDAFMKSLTLSVGVYNALFWRTMVATLFGAALWRAGGARRPGGRTMRLHLARGLVGTGMALLFFWGLARVPMAQAITLSYISPLLALAFAAVVLGERVGRRVALASVTALAGVGLVFAGQAHAALGPQALRGALAVLASALLYAVNLVLARMQAQAAAPGEIAFFQAAIVCGLLALAAPWLAVPPPASLWWQLVAAALLATVSAWLLAWAYAHGATGFLATTEYTSFVYAALLGWLVFGERLSAWTLVGAVVIVAACLIAARSRDIARQSLEQTL